jgi:hypothetical protein
MEGVFVGDKQSLKFWRVKVISVLQAEFHLTLRIRQVPVESAHFVELLERPDSDKSDNAERGQRIVLERT